MMIQMWMMMSVWLLLLALSVRAAAAVEMNEGMANCRVFQPFVAVQCEGIAYTPTYEDLSDCGKHPLDRPCFAAASLADGVECGKCYTVRYQGQDSDDSIACSANGCQGYERSVFIKMVSVVLESEQHLEMALGHGAFEQLCPFLCLGSDICVEHGEQCRHGVVPRYQWTDGRGDRFNYAGSCAARGIAVEYLEEPCPLA